MKSTSFKAGLNNAALPTDIRKKIITHAIVPVLLCGTQFKLTIQLFNDGYSVLSEALLYLKMTGFFQETVNKKSKLSAEISPRKLHDHQG